MASDGHCVIRKDNDMRMHRCNFLGCRSLVPASEKFCKKHAEQNQADRDKYLTDYKQGIKGSLKERHDNSVANKKYNEETRSTDSKEFYSGTRWSHTANHIRIRDSYTSAVSGKILNNGDIQVDHIIKRNLVPKEDWYNTNNLWLLSRREHQLKTSIELKMIRDGKSDVLRHLGKDWWAKVLRERLYGE